VGVTLPEDVAKREVENTATLAYAHEEVEGLVQKVTLLEGEPAKACRAREMAEGKFHTLSDAVADGVWWMVVFGR
jgi:hypothetical protein